MAQKDLQNQMHFLQALVNTEGLRCSIPWFPEVPNPEIVSVFAHEVGHYKKKHIIVGMLLSFLYMGFVFYLLSIFINRKELFDAFYIDHPSIYAGLVFFGLLFEPLSFLFSIAFNALSRYNEKRSRSVCS